MFAWSSVVPSVSVRARFVEGADDEEEEKGEEEEEGAAVGVFMKPSGFSHDVAPLLLLNQYALLCVLLNSSVQSDALLLLLS